jgi:pentatricopeptide repeat protein
MIAQLPENLKEQAVELIRAGRFTEAKDLHDEWLEKNCEACEYSA